MTDGHETATPVGILATGNLYRQDGMLMMATSTTHLKPIHGGATRLMNSSAELHSLRGSSGWDSSMIDAWRILTDQLAALQSRTQGLITRLDGLGNALLEKAEEKGWCDEYEEFAEEWDLPKRTHDYKVTIEVGPVTAKNADEARRMVQKSYTEFEYDFSVEETDY